MSNSRSLTLGLYLYGALLNITLTAVSLYLALTQHQTLITPLALAPEAFYFGFRSQRILAKFRHQQHTPFSYSLPLTIILYIIALGATLIRGYATIVSAGAPTP